MDFDLTEEQKMFRAMVRDFADKEIKPRAAQVDETGEFPWDNIKKMAEIGLFGVGFPEKYGGNGADLVCMAIATEELSRACASTGVIYAAQVSLAGYPIYYYGNEEQRQRFVHKITKGEILACFALTESGAGSDAAALQTQAKKESNGFVLNGNKIFITNGAEAGVAVVFATTDRKLGHRGITALLVEKGTAGFSVGKKEHKLGIRGSSTAELIFDNCLVPLNNQLGENGRGFRLALETIDGSRVNIAAQAIGIAQAAFDEAVNYAKNRQQFGQTIGNFQAIQWMLADMATSLDAARLLTYRAAFLKDKGRLTAREAAMAKLFASEMSRMVVNNAVQIHGGYGYCKDYPVERFLRDAKITEIYEGTSEMQRWTIARSFLQ